MQRNRLRAIISSRRDEEAEKRKLKEECDRLQREEEDRALRMKRRRMEALDEEERERLKTDDELMSSFMKRLQNIDGEGEGEGDGDGEGEVDQGTKGKDTTMRHSPIPDRGTGSMLLDRPEEGGGDAGDKENTDDSNASKDELEMLNRMWNLNADGDDRKSKS